MTDKHAQPGLPPLPPEGFSLDAAKSILALRDIRRLADRMLEFTPGGTAAHDAFRVIAGQASAALDTMQRTTGIAPTPSKDLNA